MEKKERGKKFSIFSIHKIQNNYESNVLNLDPKKNSDSNVGQREREGGGRHWPK